MSQHLSLPQLDKTAEISALIETLIQSERRLAELTAGLPANAAELDAAGVIVSGKHLDVTGERLAAKSLAESELRFRQMAEYMTDAYFLQNLDGTEIYYLSPAFEKIWGRSCASLYVNPNSWIETIHPDDRHHALPHMRQGGRSGFDYECRIIRPDGEIRWIHVIGYPICDATGEPDRTAGVCTDITARRQATDEVRRLNATLEQTVEERTAELQAANKELEAFDYSISHDLRAPIRHIEGFSALLLEQYGDKLDAPGRDYLQRIRNAGNRMEQLVGDLLALSLISRCDMHRTRVAMSELALAVLDELKQTEPERQIECVVTPGLSANADRGQLQIVLENLIRNAWKFTGKRSGAKIEIGCEGTEAAPIFYVRDNGAGFDAQCAGRLFAPFQRLHKQTEFKGTGIGLATVRRIITRHGGKVWAEGSVGEGATIRFTLPR